ncbi:MAG: DUF4124 domain-containing protein [Steroidobacteraceae bacterium]
MRRHALTIILASLALAPALASTTVYRWVDEQGVVHYSDQPHQGAQKMRVEDAPTFSAPPVPRTPDAAPSAAGAGEGGASAASCSIESPSDQQTLMNVYSVSGTIQMPSPLTAGARVILMLDGKVLAGAADLSGAFHIPQVDRGAHTLAAQVQSPDGQVICQTRQITFFVHQPSVQNPQNPLLRRPH